MEYPPRFSDIRIFWKYMYVHVRNVFRETIFFFKKFIEFREHVMLRYVHPTNLTLLLYESVGEPAVLEQNAIRWRELSTMSVTFALVPLVSTLMRRLFTFIEKYEEDPLCSMFVPSYDREGIGKFITLVARTRNRLEYCRLRNGQTAIPLDAIGLVYTSSLFS